MDADDVQRMLLAEQREHYPQPVKVNALQAKYAGLPDTSAALDALVDDDLAVRSRDAMRATRAAARAEALWI